MTIFFQKDQLLRNLCTLKIGGPAKLFTTVRTVEQMAAALNECNKQGIPYFILGKGSNCLFSDQGFDGAVILNKINFLNTLGPGVFHAGGGYSFSLLGTQTAREGWSGLEFASGIPGTVGGAVFMNAGANGREVCESLMSVDYLTPQGKLETISRGSIPFSYRSSMFQQMDGAIVGATFCLPPSHEARAKQMEILAYRKRTQPYQDPSAGCIFRNPLSGSAGALIDQAGLKDTQIGDAKVSPVHANFIVNAGQATATEVLALIDHIRTEVRKKTGVLLESEVRYIK